MTFATRFAQHLFFILAGLIFCEANGFAIPRAINLISEEGTTLNFGKLRKGDKSTKKIHFKNIGRRRIHLLQGHIGKGIFTFSGGKFPGIGGNCTSVIKPGKSCEVVIAVAATSIGKKAATFNFTHQERNEQSTMLLKLEAEVLPYLPPNIFLMYGYSDADKVSQNQKAPYVSLEEWDDKWGEVIKDFTVIEGITKNAALVTALKKQGKLFAYHVAANFPNGKAPAASDPCLKHLTKNLLPENTKPSDVKSGVDYFVCQWSKPFEENLNGKLPDHFDAIMIDEFHSYPDGTPLNMIQNQALAKVRQKYPYKIILVSGVVRLGYGGEKSSINPNGVTYDASLKAIRDNADVFVYENYQASSNPRFDSFTKVPENFNIRCPGLINKTVFALAISQTPGVNYDRNPHIDFHEFLLDQLALARKAYVDYKMVKGLAFWIFYRAKVKTVDLTMEMVRDF